MVLISIVAVWLALALVLGVVLGRSIRRADVVELNARASWDAGRGADRPVVAASSEVAADSPARPVVAAQAA